jgi:hypothetical protein
VHNPSTTTKTAKTPTTATIAITTKTKNSRSNLIILLCVCLSYFLVPFGSLRLPAQRRIPVDCRLLLPLLPHHHRLNHQFDLRTNLPTHPPYIAAPPHLSTFRGA